MENNLFTFIYLYILHEYVFTFQCVHQLMFCTQDCSQYAYMFEYLTHSIKELPII